MKLCKSTSGVKLGPTHPGRPQDEEPHVKKTIKGKREISEYIVRVDQVRIVLSGASLMLLIQDELGLLEDEFDDLKDNFKVLKLQYLSNSLSSILRCLMLMRMGFSTLWRFNMY